ncbi:MAG TPA: ABC transporter substrate-binding protein, partial [Acidimicrobiia bacterium]|nr:ABC transporter substrate-binding protein [Acidimicrobiia bacterium]
AEQEAGIAADVDADVSARAPQSVYTPIIQQMKDAGSTYGRSGLGSDSTLALRKEAKIQGLTSVKVWDCAVQCYNTDFVEQGGADIEDQFVYLGFVPFEEAKSNKMMSDFLKFTGRAPADGFGAQAWASAIYFRDIVEQIVETDGANGVTRAAVLAGADAINDFTAEGMIAPTDVGDRVATKCFALLQVKSSKFVRVHPKKKGTFDCKSSDVATLELDLIG